ncbi:MAG TPA: hypothetical protein VHF26_03255 [Trebonia sp.]|nr:hypothetical protein [Trebonia sp.]
MSTRFHFPSAARAAQPAPHGPDSWTAAENVATVGSACCCPARPAVRVVMPSGPSRPHPTELLLCGHHYLVSRDSLAAARAVVRQLPDTPADVAAWIGLKPAAVIAAVG